MVEKNKMKVIYLPIALVLGVVLGSLSTSNKVTLIGKDTVEKKTAEPVMIGKEYFDFDVETQTDTTSYLKIGEIPSDDVSDIEYSNEERDYDEKIMMKPDFGVEPIVREADLDADGIKETVVVKAASLKNSPHQLFVIKDKKIVFESSPMSYVGYDPSPASNGFYLYATPDSEVGTGYRVIRVISKDGKFVPVWQQSVKFFKYL